MNAGMVSKSAILQGGKSGTRFPGGNNVVTGAGMGKGGMGGMSGGMGGRHPDTTADTRNPKVAITVRRAGLVFRSRRSSSAGRRHRRHAAGRSRVGAAVERWWWRWRPAVVDAVRAIEPAAHQLGPLCAERGGGRSRIQRLAADHQRRCCAGIASPSSRRSICNPPARRSAACGSTTGAACRPWCARWRPRDLRSSRTSLRRCRKPSSAPVASACASSNTRSPACGCRRRIRSPTANAC